MSAIGKRNTSCRASKPAHGWGRPLVIGAAREDFRGKARCWSSQRTGQDCPAATEKGGSCGFSHKGCEAECPCRWVRVGRPRGSDAGP